MFNWITELFTNESVPQTVLVYALVIAFGLWLGRIKLMGISFGVTWILFMGILASYIGIRINESTEHFLKEFGLVLFVYAVGLQVGPGFFSSLKKNALANNILAASVVLCGVALTWLAGYLTKTPVSTMSGVMSGAVTNTPGLAAAQAAVRDTHVSSVNPSVITLAYAVTYPFGVIGIILSLIILRKLLGISIPAEQELHRKLEAIRSNRPASMHFNLENHQMTGKPLRVLIDMCKEPIVISRMYHRGQVITPTPETVMDEKDVLLILASKKQLEQCKLLIGSESAMNLKNEPGSKLVSRHIVVTRKNITHKRLGDIDELHQPDITLTRINRAGIDMVANGDIFLQLGDTIKVVGSEEGINRITHSIGNELKRLETPDLAPIFIGIVLGVILGSIPFHFPGMPVAVKIGMAGGPLIIALLLSRYGNFLYLTNYTTYSANLMIRELGIALFLASVGLESGHMLSSAFSDGSGLTWVLMGIAITLVPLILVGLIAHRYFRKTYFEICGLLAGASTDPPALAFALKTAGNDIPSATYATVYPMTMILRILAAQLMILLLS